MEFMVIFLARSSKAILSLLKFSLAFNRSISIVKLLANSLINVRFKSDIENDKITVENYYVVAYLEYWI